MNQYEMKQRAYQSNLKSRALQVLLYLIDRSNKEQTCFPAVPTIGKELHISIFFGVFIPLRSYLGGFHMNSYWACFICSSTVLVGILLLVRFCNPNPIVSWIMLIFSVVIIVWKAKKASEVDEEGQHYYPRICIIVVGILFVSIIFFAISKFSLLFLIACTNVLVVISKFLEKRQEE